MEKLDLKKVKSELFKGKDGEIREVFSPKSFYICLDGEGDPNTNPKYNQVIEALYNAAYTLKFMYKAKGLDFVVMPLSSLWWVKNSDEIMTQENKDKWQWRAMIEIPSYVTEDDIELAKDIAYKKSGKDLIKEILHRELNENKCFQVLHVGPYDEENEKVCKMHEVIKQRGYALRGRHHEIYLNDPRKVESSKIKTIIRQPVYKEDEEILDFEMKKSL